MYAYMYVRIYVHQHGAYVSVRMHAYMYVCMYVRQHGVYVSESPYVVSYNVKSIAHV